MAALLLYRQSFPLPEEKWKPEGFWIQEKEEHREGKKTIVSSLALYPCQS